MCLLESFIFNRQKMDACPLVFAILAQKNGSLLTAAKQKELQELINVNTYQSIESMVNACFRNETIRIVQISKEYRPPNSRGVLFFVPTAMLSVPSPALGLNTYFADRFVPTHRCKTYAISQAPLVLFETDCKPRQLSEWREFEMPPDYTQIVLTI
jgi:hypothetical protein